MTNQFKNALRKTMKQIRSKLSVTYRNNSSYYICSRIKKLKQYQEAQHIAIYSAINGEIDLTLLWSDACNSGKTCYFPILNDDSTLSFVPADFTTEFKNNHLGIPEPINSSSTTIPIEELDLIIIPLLAFDVHCARLGMGLGCYDRTLGKKKTNCLIGVAYQFQRIDFIEEAAWDVPLDGVITQKAAYWRYNSKC